MMKKWRPKFRCVDVVKKVEDNEIDKIDCGSESRKLPLRQTCLPPELLDPTPRPKQAPAAASFLAPHLSWHFTRRIFNLRFVHRSQASFVFGVGSKSHERQ
jgi:hypothetical protein